LEPNLGSLYGVILADVPGLIEGAAEGKGLGHKFLRHVKRTNLLLHCISADTENFEVAYNTVRKELEKFDEEMAKKEEIILITKTDMVDEKTLKDLVKKYSKTHKVLTVSILDDDSLKSLSDTLVKIVKK
jgi:GTP-binding protein